MKLLQALQQDYIDLSATLATAVITELENLVQDLGGIGGYMLINTPQDIYTPNGWGRWVEDVQASFDDEGDSRRPRFSDSAVCGGLVLVAGSPSLEGFVEAIKPLALLFDLNGFDEKLAQIIQTLNSYQTPSTPSQYPDWQALQARDIRASQSNRILHTSFAVCSEGSDDLSR